MSSKDKLNKEMKQYMENIGTDDVWSSFEARTLFLILKELKTISRKLTKLQSIDEKL